MTPQQYSEVRQLYKFAVAYDSFWAVRKSCENLITSRAKTSDPSYYVTSVGIVCTYGRPFTDNKLIGTISPSSVPKEFKRLHSSLIELRNKGFAHIDTAGQLPGHGKMTEFRLVFTGTNVKTFSSRPIFNPELLPYIKALSDLLAQKMEEHRQSLLDRLVKVIVPSSLKPISARNSNSISKIKKVQWLL